MGRIPCAAVTALTTSALMCCASDASAMRAETGGTAAPIAAEVGGAQFGVPAASARPVLTRLEIPATALAGRPPRVTLELTEHGVRTVFLRVLIIALASRRTAVTATMGWVRTGRAIAVAWPAGARLRAGSYRVTVSAHDRRNGNIVRRARISGFATLTVTAPAAPAPVPATPAPEAGVLTPAQTAAAGAVFPVAGPHNFGGPENRFGAPRSGHTHQGQDVLAAEGTPIRAPLAGTIVQATYQAGGAGYYTVEHTASGFDFMFAHCRAGTLAVSANESVRAGQQLCEAGQTGYATTPHLHFEIWVGGWAAAAGHPIDPLPYLQAWDREGAG
jgi:biotin carboxyl carrier protein